MIYGLIVIGAAFGGWVLWRRAYVSVSTSARSKRGRNGLPSEL
jgi:hypothetical protein